MRKDYYEILGVDRNATDSEIKNAYKREVIKWHPDKWTGASEEEKKVAESKFKELQEAYSCLSDPNEKNKYDLFGGQEEPSVFDWYFSQYKPYKERKAQKSKPIYLNVEVSIEELFNGIDREISFTNIKRCHSCNGKQGEGKKICTTCGGTGIINEMISSLVGYSFGFSKCNRCNGTGKIFEKLCTTCNGTGVEKFTDTIKLSFPGPLQINSTKTIVGKGIQDNDSSISDGDIIIQFIPKVDETRYYIDKDGSTIFERLNVNIIDCLLGCELPVLHPSGEHLTINIPECCKNNMRISIPNKGLLPGTSYNYIINYIMPGNLTEEQRNLLVKFKSLQ